MHANDIVRTLRRLEDAFKADPQWLDQVLRDAGIDPLTTDNWQPFVSEDHYGLMERVRQILYSIGTLTWQ